MTIDQVRQHAFPPSMKAEERGCTNSYTLFSVFCKVAKAPLFIPHGHPRGFGQLWDEFEAGRTKEARLAQGLDRAQAVLQSLHTDKFWNTTNPSPQPCRPFGRSFVNRSIASRSKPPGTNDGRKRTILLIDTSSTKSE
jgi:hypothetical protein